MAHLDLFDIHSSLNIDYSHCSYFNSGFVMCCYVLPYKNVFQELMSLLYVLLTVNVTSVFDVFRV